jgi:hypothetical protein
MVFVMIIIRNTKIRSGQNAGILKYFGFYSVTSVTLSVVRPAGKKADDRSNGEDGEKLVWSNQFIVLVFVFRG